MTALAERLIQRIRNDGPISVAAFMTAALYDPQHGYYAARDIAEGPGVGGDFLTAPEISQMFGELIGAWIVHEWRAIGEPSPTRLIELGPGKGLLCSDAWRAIRNAPNASAALMLELVEVNPSLRKVQTTALADVGAACRHYDRIDDVPLGPCFILANEFLDCLPIRQFVRTAEGWRERLIGVRDDRLVFGLAPGPIPDPSILPIFAQGAPIGAIVEITPGLGAFVDALAQRLISAPGRALVIDYGPAESQLGDTLQAVRAHAKVGALDCPGEADLTAHVDFSALRNLALQAGLAASPIITQSSFLGALGLAARADRLRHSRPDHAARIDRQVDRLIGHDAMGALFKVICLSSPALSPPAGF